MKKILATSKTHGNHFVLVSNEDFELVSKYHWYVKKHGNTFYAWTKSTRDIGQTSVHRLILGFPESGIDHRDCNGLNNQRDNLRLCNQSQNNQNRTPQKSIYGYKGVKKNWKKYSATISVFKREIYIGTFNTPIEAAKAYNEAAIKYFGEFANLNVV